MQAKNNVPLAPYTSFHIGGPADLFLEAETPEEFIDAIHQARSERKPYFILGGGSNTLFHDKGFRGIVIKPAFKKIEINGEQIIADAGALTSMLVAKSVENALQGIEGWVGLPGTVGGAIRGNAGASGVEVKDVLINAYIFDPEKNEARECSNKELDLGYRHSLLKDNKNLIVLRGTFELKKIESPAILRATMAEILRKRNATQPKGKSAGCVFKNPAPGISAGKMIDESGCKNLRVGDIEISNVHGNFFLNHGHGTQKDVLELIKMAQQKVKAEKGYDLTTEIEIVPERAI